jgi:xanthine dehydrogenase accessory factor
VALDPYQSRLVPDGELDKPGRRAGCRSIMEKGTRFLHFLGPSYTLLLIGVSEVSKAVAKMASLMDYHVVLCDPRPEVLKEWDVEGVTVVQGMPDDVISAQPKLGYTAILALTHDPRIDDMGLMEALTTDAFYIGAMGSNGSASRRNAC